MSAKYTLHHDRDRTVTLQVRIVAIENGWLIKAGEAPFFCDDEATLRKEITSIVDGFIKDTADARSDT